MKDLGTKPNGWGTWGDAHTVESSTPTKAPQECDHCRTKDAAIFVELKGQTEKSPNWFLCSFCYRESDPKTNKVPWETIGEREQ